MGNKLLTLLNFSLIVSAIVFLSMVPSIGMAQSAGDIAFTGYNGDGDDDFAIVALSDIPANSVIFFTDHNWDGSSFVGAGDTFSWDTGSSVIAAGTIITFNDINTGGRTVSTGSYSSGNAITLTVSNTVIFSYTGAEDNPSAFISAIATNSDQYDGTDGTLDNTGLNQGSTAILLSTNVDGAAYTGDRSGNTSAGYRTQLNDIATNWQEESSDGTNLLPFSTQNFVLIDPPTLAFTVSSAFVAEDAGTTTLTVELVEAAGTAVDVDVVFLSGSSSAAANDINSYSTQTVSFGSGDASGATRDVTITLTDDSDFEGDEIAVFQLQNISEGSVITPGVLNLTITDDDAPAIVLNEIHADPDGTNGDADGNGAVDSGDDEFLEFVNTTTSDIDISGWQVFDDPALNLRHTFPSGTVIPASGALVLFADDNVSPRGGFGGAVVQSSNESATLSLNNSGDTITLQDASGNEILSVTYSGADNNQSINLDPELNTSSAYSDHSTVSGSGGSLFSPGTHVDGTAFGSTYAIGIRGNEGYRFISTPAQNTSFNDFFGAFWTQGITGADANSGDAANIFSWQESGGGTFAAVSDMNDNLTAGQGYIIYVFEDDDFRTPGMQGGFPKTINTNETENSSPVSVAVSANDVGGAAGIDENEGYNLLGNPYGTDVSVAAVIDALEAAAPSATVNANLYVWDHDANGGNGDYQNLTDGDRLAPFQAFFMRYTSDGVSANASFDRSDLALNEGAEFYGRSPEARATSLSFELSMGDGNRFDTYEIEFNENGTLGEDRYDAYKLFSLNGNSINLYSTVGEGVKLAKNVIPSISSLQEDAELRIPVGYVVPRSGEYVFSWGDLESIPEEVELYLIDNQTGREINLKSQEEYRVSIQNDTNQENKKTEQSNILSPMFSSAAGIDDRFELLVVASSEPAPGEPEPMQEPVVLSPNYPNPFNSNTTMDLQLKERMHVEMTIWNIVGQKVATIVDRMMDAGGPTPMTWNVPANMPSGIYICKVEAGEKIITRKMTLVK